MKSTQDTYIIPRATQKGLDLLEKVGGGTPSTDEEVFNADFISEVLLFTGRAAYLIYSHPSVRGQYARLIKQGYLVEIETPKLTVYEKAFKPRPSLVSKILQFMHRDKDEDDEEEFNGFIR